MYARKGGEDVQSQAVNLGGDKISVDDATVSLLNYVNSTSFQNASLSSLKFEIYTSTRRDLMGHNLIFAEWSITLSSIEQKLEGKIHNYLVKQN